ncbi:MAG: hypothetical protein U9R06_00650, partial [Patescibacteria group bacterium]|nr:hypothetical protein [Patescibacteria group bacterium]
TTILLLAIFYFTFVKATIILIPNQERISNSMIVDIVDIDKEKQASGKMVIGQVKTVNIEHEKNYESSGTEIIGEETVGEVVIINNYNKNQPLVATTRLITADNKLFRIKDTINVPAGDSLKVAVYADEPSENMAIAPTKFTIPGLWAGLQDKIYAESKEAMAYQKQVKKHIEKDDIDNGIRDLKQALLNKAKDIINDNYQNYSQIIYRINEDSIASEVYGEIGEEVDDFKISMSADIAVVAFDDSQTAELAKQKFLSALSENKELIDFEEENIVYVLDSYDEIDGKAAISATFEGRVSLREGAKIIEIDKILGLNKNQLDAYLTELPEIAGYEVKFFPSFIQRVPKLVDRVEVIIKK